MYYQVNTKIQFPGCCNSYFQKLSRKEEIWFWKFDNNIPIYIQISNIIKLQIVTKQLKSVTSCLLSVIWLKQLVSIPILSNGPSDLETEGFVYSVRTTGRFVTDNVDLIQRTRVELA